MSILIANCWTDIKCLRKFSLLFLYWFGCISGRTISILNKILLMLSRVWRFKKRQMNCKRLFWTTRKKPYEPILLESTGGHYAIFDIQLRLRNTKPITLPNCLLIKHFAALLNGPITVRCDNWETTWFYGSLSSHLEFLMQSSSLFIPFRL